MFQNHDTWWDLLCILDLPNNTGSVYTVEEKRQEDIANQKPGSNSSSSHGSGGGGSGSPRQQPPEESLHVASDAKFIAALQSGIEARLGENWVRHKFYELTSSIVALAQDPTGLQLSIRLSDKARKVVEAQSHRANGLRQSTEVAGMPPNPWAWAAKNKGGALVDGSILRLHVRRLLLESDLQEADAEGIFADLSRDVQSETDFQALLSLLPESDGGLYPVAVGLLSPSPVVRASAVRLLSGVQKFDSTRTAFATLNGLLRNAYLRQQAMVVSASEI